MTEEIEDSGTAGMGKRSGAGAGGRRTRRPRKPLGPVARSVARWTFHLHLWGGVLLSVLVVLLAVTGILLNHKRPLGLMPDVEHSPERPFAESLGLADLAERGREALPAELRESPVDRMDVRPDDGLVKVRFDDPAVTEVTVDLTTGRILGVGERNDVFLEKLHSGEIFGDRGILLTDAAAVGLMLLVLSGYWMWLFPRWRR